MVLRQAGIDPVVIVSGADENALVASLPAPTSPEDRRCSRESQSHQRRLPLPSHVTTDCIVIG
jgi:septum formation protein